MSRRRSGHDQDVGAGSRQLRIGGQFHLEAIGPSITVGVGPARIGAPGPLVDVGQGVAVDVRIVGIPDAVAVEIGIEHERCGIPTIANGVVVGVRIQRIGAGGDLSPVGQTIAVGIGPVGLGAGHGELPQVGNTVPIQVTGGIVDQRVQAAGRLERVGHAVTVGIDQRVDDRLHQEEFLAGLGPGVRIGE